MAGTIQFVDWEESMVHRLLLMLVLGLCSVAIAGCVDSPFVISAGPYFVAGDPGVALDGLDHGVWMDDNKQQVTFKPDDATQRPGDYVLTFTHNALPEPLPEGDNGPVTRDPGNPENNVMLEAHIFDIDGQLYMDVAKLAPLGEPMPDVPLSRGIGNEDHVLFRLTPGIGQFTLEAIDVQWWTGMASWLSADISFVYPEPLPDKPDVPIMRDTPERLTAFVKKFAKEITWSQATVFRKQPSK